MYRKREMYIFHLALKKHSLLENGNNVETQFELLKYNCNF